MIKIFNKTADYETYSANGINSGELCYVKEDKSAHFRTNNIDGTDKTYDMSEGGGSTEPEYTELNLNTLTVHSDGKNYSTLITATLGQTIEIYNPNHLTFSVGQGQPGINPVDGEIDGYVIFQNGICSTNDTGTNDTDIIYLEHLYVQNAPNIWERVCSENGFAITYYSAAGTPIDGVIYYRIIDDASEE